MDIRQAREVIAVSSDKQAALAAAHDRYMCFCGVYTAEPEDDHVAEDRAAFPGLLAHTADGRPSLSDERCAGTRMISCCSITNCQKDED